MQWTAVASWQGRNCWRKEYGYMSTFHRASHCRGTPPLLPSEKRNLERLQRSLHRAELGRSPADASGRPRARGQLPGASGPASLTPSRASSFCAPVSLSSGDDNLKVTISRFIIARVALTMRSASASGNL